MYFITNNTAKIQLKILGRTFRLTSCAIVNAKKLTLCWVYPSGFIDRCIRQFLNKKFSQHPKTQTQTCNHFTFKLSYQGNISHNIEKELQQFIMKQLPDSKLRFIHTTTKLKHYFHTKDPQSHLRRSNLVYHLNCSSRPFDIGQTRRNLIKRLQEHHTRDTSEVCNHIQSNTHHKVDFNNPQTLPTPQINTNSSSSSPYSFNNSNQILTYTPHPFHSTYLTRDLLALLQVLSQFPSFLYHGLRPSIT